MGIPKMAKFENDKCFGKKYDQIEQCKECWIKKACHVEFINRKK